MLKTTVKIELPKYRQHYRFKVTRGEHRGLFNVKPEYIIAYRIVEGFLMSAGIATSSKRPCEL